MILVTVFLLVAIPLWVFWDDIDAARRGMSPMEYIDWQIAKLNKEIAEDTERQANPPARPRKVTPSEGVKASLRIAAVDGAIYLLAHAYLTEFTWLRYVADIALGAGIGCLLRAGFFAYKAHTSRT